jgi:hypothetical protein
MTNIIISREAELEVHIIESIRAGSKKASEVAQRFGYSEDEVWTAFFKMVQEGKLRLEVI